MNINLFIVSFIDFHKNSILTFVNSKPCGIRAARKLRVVRRQERWADKVIALFSLFYFVEVQEGSQHLFH